MRNILLLSLLLVLGTGQATESSAQARGTAQPRRAAPAPARSGIAVTVTGPDRAVLADIAVDVTGPDARMAVTDAAGQASFPGLAAGTYRLRFSGDSVATFEREVTLRAGQVTRLDISLNSAPARAAAAPPPPPPAPAAPPVGPRGAPHVVSMIDLVERELVRNEQPRKDTLVACSGNTRSMLVQLNEPQATRVYESAEVLYYVIAGEGAIAVEGRNVPLVAGTYAALPSGASHSMTRKGRRPLILLAILSGEPCEVAR